MLKNMVTDNEINRVIRNRPFPLVFNQGKLVYIRISIATRVDINTDYARDLASQNTQVLAELNRVAGSAGTTATAKIKDTKMWGKQGVNSAIKRDRTVDIREPTELRLRIECFNSLSSLSILLLSYCLIRRQVSGVPLTIAHHLHLERFE